MYTIPASGYLCKRDIRPQPMHFERGIYERFHCALLLSRLDSFFFLSFTGFFSRAEGFLQAYALHLSLEKSYNHLGKVNFYLSDSY